MTQATKHTPTPWRFEVVGSAGDYSNPVDVCEIATEYKRIAEYVNESDAAHIVRCVNAHDELVAALTKIAQWDHPSHPVFENTPVSVDALANIARAALAKVQA
jgi:hypothetical protein